MQYRSGHKTIANNLAEMFLDYDIVLTTYHEVLGSFTAGKAPLETTDPDERKEYYENNKGILHTTKFLRVVLDEAQSIKNHASQTSLACRALTATHCWAITGTPIMNTTKEFYPYFDFVREPCAGSYELFRQNFSKDAGYDGEKRLSALLRKSK